MRWHWFFFSKTGTSIRFTTRKITEFHRAAHGRRGNSRGALLRSKLALREKQIWSVSRMVWRFQGNFSGTIAQWQSTKNEVTGPIPNPEGKKATTSMSPLQPPPPTTTTKTGVTFLFSSNLLKKVIMLHEMQFPSVNKYGNWNIWSDPTHTWMKWWKYSLSFLRVPESKDTRCSSCALNLSCH